MYPLNRLSVSVLSRTRKITELASLLAIFGMLVMLAGGVWDSASHEMRIPDTFWTIQHMTIYTGASLVACSAISSALVFRRCKNRTVKRGMVLIIVGAVMQLGGGYADYNFHEVYGIDGLVTPSHLTIETGLLLSAAGGFATVSQSTSPLLLRLAPLSIMTVLLSALWIGFNLVLLLGSAVMCIPVFQLFYSGCAVM